MRWLACLVVFSLVLSVSAPAAAEDEAEDDPSALAWTGAAASACTLAFGVYLLTRNDDAFGPRALVDVSLGLSMLGAAGAHAAGFGLLRIQDRRMRTILGGLTLASTGLSLLAFALPTAWALTSDPPTGEDAAAIVAPYFLGVIGVVGMIAGAWIIARPSDPRSVIASLSIAPTTTSASLVLRGRF